MSDDETNGREEEDIKEEDVKEEDVKVEDDDLNGNNHADFGDLFGSDSEGERSPGPPQVDESLEKSFLDELDEEAQEQEDQRALLEDAEYNDQAIGPPLDLQINDLPRRDPSTPVVLVKLPGIISIEPKRYDPQIFAATEANLEDELDEDGNVIRRARPPESVIRWREVKDESGNMKRESNARFVKWSDGSMNLMIGNEVLDANIQPLQGEFHYYLARHPQFLETHGALDSKLVLRPSSLNSKLHQKLSVSMAEKAHKITKVKLVTTTEDPEAAKARKEKLEEDRIKSNQKLETEQRNRASKLGLDAGYLEGEYDESGGYNSRHDRYNRYASRDKYSTDDGFVVDEDEDAGDEEAEDLNEFRNRHAKKKKRERNEEEDAERLMKVKEATSPEPAPLPPKKEKTKKREREREKKTEKEEEKEEEIKDEDVDVMIQEDEEPTTTTTTTTTLQEDDDNTAVVQLDEEEEEVVSVKKPKRRNVVIDDDDE